MHGMSYWKAALSSKYWISNVNIECGLSFKKNQQIYINTWHGTGAKKVGNAVGGRNDYDFSNVDIISSDGPLLNQIMINDFNAQESSLMMCGRPREDSLYRMNEFDRGRIKRSLGIQDDSHVVLYAPTWRESLDGGTTFRYEPPIHIEKWATLLGENTVVLFRAHSITTDTMDLEGLDHVIDCSNYPELNELMFVSDALISDYSGIFIDFASQRKPIFSFAYDYDEYASSRGMYFDIRDYITTFYSEDEMMNYLKDFDYSFESDKAGLFFDTFAGYGGNAATKCIDKMLELGRSK